MKKSILTLAIIALSFTTSNAKPVAKTAIATESNVTLTKDQIVEVYNWSVKTNQGNYSGTTSSLAEAQKTIALSTVNEIIVDKKIESYYQPKSEIASNKTRLYFWEATTNYGKAKGFSNSESQAKKMIQLVSKGDVLNYKIIQSANF
jgi:hypothetical protein